MAFSGCFLAGDDTASVLKQERLMMSTKAVYKLIFRHFALNFVTFATLET